LVVGKIVLAVLLLYEAIEIQLVGISNMYQRSIYFAIKGQKNTVLFKLCWSYFAI